MIRRIIAVAILLAIPTIAGAGNWEAWRAMALEDYETAREEWLVEAKRGSSTAMYQLGVIYSEGKGVPVDMAAAMEWFRKAAKNWHIGASYRVAMGYLEGSGLPQDDKLGLKWLRKAVKKGSSEAELQLARMHDAGDRVSHDRDRAMDWYKKAAKHGQLEAQMLLARSYLEGDRLKPDSLEAYSWAIRAATSEDPEALSLVNEILAILWPEGIPELRKLAIADYRQGRYDLAAISWLWLANLGVVEAQIALAEVYTQGRGVLKNLTEAYKWMTIAHDRHEASVEKKRGEIAAYMSAADIEKAKRLAARWKPDESRPMPVFPYPRAEEHDDISPPLLIESSKVHPEFPERHRIEREGGSVILLAVIRKDGTVGDISVLRGSMAYSEFEWSATSAVSQWRYEPAMKDGKPIDVMFTIYFNFTIH
jgi:TonB family protein